VKLVADYQAAEKLLDRNLKPEFVSLEGYLSGRLVASALEKTGPDPTRADMLRVIHEVGRFDISGMIVTFGPNADDAPSKVFLTVIQRDGTFKAVEKL
jgi:ABC-type branched-subunit amino acid transport system substrate-binding protein